MKFEKQLMIVGQNVRRARIEAGYKSQRKFAKDLEISHTLLSEIERGISTASISLLKRIGNILGVSTAFFYEEASERKNQIEVVHDLLLQKTNLDQAKEISLQLLQSALPGEEQVSSMNLLANVYIQIRQYTDAIKILEEAMPIAKITKNKCRQLQIITNYILALYLDREYHKMLFNVDLALDLSHDEAQNTKLLLMKGAALQEMGSYHKAIVTYEECLTSIKKGVNNYLDRLNCLSNLAICHYENNDYNQALSNISIAMKLADEVKEQQVSTYSLVVTILCEVLCKLGKMNDAKQIILQTLCFETLKMYPFRRSCLQLVLAKCVPEIHEKEQILLEVFNVVQNLDPKWLFSSVCFELAELYNSTGKYAEACVYYRHAQISTRIGHTQFSERSHYYI